MPPAPARLSITIGWPSTAAIFGSMARRIRSGGPPGGEGTTTLMGLFGKPCACARPHESAASTASQERRFIARTPWGTCGSVQPHRLLRLDRGKNGLQHRHVVDGVAAGQRNWFAFRRVPREVL